jgi:methyl-accepting chemotaxis protein
MTPAARFNVKSAVLSIVALAVLVMAALVGIGVYSQNAQEALHAKVLQDEKLTLAFDSLEIDFLQARRAEKDFLLRRDEKYVTRHAGIMEKMAASLTEARALMQSGGQLKPADLDAFGDALKEYQLAFKAMTGSHRLIGLDENSGLQGQLRSAVHEIETSLKELNQPELEVKMLMMRRHEKDFIMRGAPKYLDRLNARVEEFRAFPDSYYADSAQKDAILSKLETYQASFAAYVKESLTEADLRKTMSQKFAEAEPILEGLRHAAKEELDVLNAASAAAGQTAKQQSLILGLGGMAVFVVIALRLAFAISSPLKQLAQALKAMSDGDCTVGLRRSRIAEIAAINASVAEAQADQEVRDRMTGEIAALIRNCAAGDFSGRLDTGTASGTFAELGRGLNAIGDAAEGGLGDVRRTLDALAAGDLSRRMPTGQQGIFLDISRSVDGLADSLRSMVEQIASSSTALNSASGEIASAADDASRRVESSAAALEQTSAAVQVLNDTVRETAGSAEEARGFVNSAQEGTARTREVAGRTADAMQRIESSSSEIAKITDLIEDVAFQTNLLALNAGVEAARAGEAGRGFAVVASEVRALAQRSADAVQEINTLIKSSTHEVADGVRLVKETGEALEAIQTEVSQVAERVNSIADAASDQANGLSEVSIAVQNLDTDAQKNAATLEETAAAGQMLRGEAQTLSAAVGRFSPGTSAAAGSGSAAAPAQVSPELAEDGSSLWEDFDEEPGEPLAGVA